MSEPLHCGTVVIGVGNTILSDDGVGVHAARLLQQHPGVPAGVAIWDGGTLGLELIPYASEAYHVLLLDSMDSGNPPGTLARMTGRDLLAAKQGWSAHQLGVADLISALFLVVDHPQDIVVLGVQPGGTDWGATLSTEVEAALVPLVDAAVEQLQLWAQLSELRVDEDAFLSRPRKSSVLGSTSRFEDGGL
jgi:hydrogenase maturation protease